MSLNAVPAGKDLPNDFNVIIEISANGKPIKYEVDKDSGEIFVDRFMGTSMVYPCNYGYINQTIAGDGDPVDVLVISPFDLPPGVVIRCRALGMLEMEDDGGQDSKILAVPVSKLTPMYDSYKTYEDVPEILRQRIAHFFEHYKDLEPGKWVKVKGWKGLESAQQEILDGEKNYKNQK